MVGNIPAEKFLGGNFPGRNSDFSGGNSLWRTFLEAFSSYNVSILFFKRLSANKMKLLTHKMLFIVLFQ